MTKRNPKPAPFLSDPVAAMEIYEGPLKPHIEAIYDICTARGLPFLLCIQLGGNGESGATLANSAMIGEETDDRLVIAAGVINGTVEVAAMGDEESM